MLDSGVPVIDTRVAAECAEKTIKGAVSVPYKEKSAKAPGFDPSQDKFDLDKLPADKSAPVVFFCNSGSCWKSYKAPAVAVKGGYAKVVAPRRRPGVQRQGPARALTPPDALPA
jgi:rhodanese-related sulfurtransferase